MTHLKIGEILINEGVITEDQLSSAIETQQKNKGGRLGETLILLKYITEEQMSSALGSQLGLPYYSKENEDLLKPQTGQKLDQILPSDFARKNYVLPLANDSNFLTCAVVDPLDLLMIDNLRRLTNCDIKLVVATKSCLTKAINDFYFKDMKADGRGTLLDQAVQSSYVADKTSTSNPGQPMSSIGATAELSIDKLIEKAEEAPVVKLVDLIIRQAIDERGSDIHIEPFDNKIILRYRIDGELYNIPPPAPHLHLPIISRIKILAKLDIAEKRLPQDGAISANLEDRKVDLRVSTIPTVWGEKVVMRILDKSAVPLELTGLGFDDKQIRSIRSALESPYGLFFVTGPTGSGKSTTLYAAVNETIDPKKNVLTIEDPVEYKVDGINQVSVKADIGLTFAVALKAFLRQDPDVIMVGETRDLETASICVRAALTGHFVLSTLHTNDAASAITRLIDIGVPSYLLTPSLVLIIGQRLARRLCQKCKEPYESSEQEGEVKFKSDLIYRAKGCESCNNTGYKGRAVVCEVLTFNDDIRKLVAQDASHAQIRDAARKNGMNTIFESGLRLVDEGITSYEEVCRVSIE